MKVFREKHFLIGNFKALALLVFLLVLATTLFIVGGETVTGAVLGVRIP